MIDKDYLYASVYENADHFIPKSSSVYVHAFSTEERSHHTDRLKELYSTTVEFVQLEQHDNDIISDVQSKQQIRLRDLSKISELLNRFNRKNLYIDVTGLDNRTCAALLRCSLPIVENGPFQNVYIVYAEPDSYEISQFKTEGVFHDLSEKIDGIAPLPGFASIIPDDFNNFKLVALLGFEGGRFTQIIEAVQPTRDNVIPVIGLPGFRMDYPFHAYWGNRRPLADTETWRNVAFSPANSIVSTYDLLSQYLKNEPDQPIKVAPIGTKPHAIAAMLFAIKNTRSVELVYDNPKRKKKRTSGTGKVVECLVSQLISDC